jgi:ketosteroid isomerase-like protein
VTPAEVVRAFWDRVAAHDWAGARDLLADDVVLDYPHTGERFVGAEAVIRLNADYPEGWSIEVVDVVADGGRVVAEVEVPMAGVGVFAVASFATVADGRITRAREYWIKEAGEEPESWRAHLAQRYDGRTSS